MPTVLCILSTVAFLDPPTNRYAAGTSFSSLHSVLSTLRAARVKVVFATATGAAPAFNFETEELKRWHDDQAQVFGSPLSLQKLTDVPNYAGVIVPAGVGAVIDIAGSPAVARAVLSVYSNGQPIATVGHGACALLPAGSRSLSENWIFSGHHVTGPSIAFESQQQYFGKLRRFSLVEDAVREHGGMFTATEGDESHHIVIDRNVITAQHERSSKLAAQNLINLLNQ